MKPEIRLRIANTFAITGKCTSNNLSHLEKRNLLDIRNDSSLKIAKDDKSNASVILDADEYRRKVMNHLEDETTYKKLNDNPVNTLQKKVNRDLYKLK